MRLAFFALPGTNQFHVLASKALGTLARRLIIFLTLITTVFASTAIKAREPASMARLAEVSGMDKALEGFAAAIATQGDQIIQQGNAIGDPAAFLEAWKRAANKSFTGDALKAGFLKRLGGKFSPDEINAVVDFYQSDLGKRLVAAEVAAGTEARQQEMANLAPSLMEGLAKDPTRNQELERIATVTNLSETMTSLALNISRAILIGIATADTSDRRMTLDDIAQVMTQQRPTIAKQMEAMTILSLAYAYKDLAIADLKEYGVFLATPSGRKFTAVSIENLDAVLSSASLTFGKLLAAELGRTPI
ncbi:MAG: DUF2059 domain-containing protein [Hyphomicrobiaceae bacterium]